jgi:hypothetical protein
MKQPGHLLSLIFNYYRENPADLSALLPLRRCRISRWWGTLSIICPDQTTLADLLEIQDLLARPLALLKIAKRVKVFWGNALVEEFLIQVPPQSLWPTAYNPYDHEYPMNMDQD